MCLYSATAGFLVSLIRMQARDVYANQAKEPASSPRLKMRVICSKNSGGTTRTSVA